MRKLLVTLIVLLVVLIGADFAGRAIAESKAGEAIARQSGITPAPGVDIHGLSFLWQAVHGTYQRITVTSQDLTVGHLTGVNATADLYDVRLPVSDAISGNVAQLSAGHADVSVTIPAAALAAVLKEQTLTIGPGQGGALRLGSTVSVAGRNIPVSIDVKPTYRDGMLRLGNPAVIQAPAAIPRELVDAAIKNFSVQLPLSALPFRLQSAAVRVEGGAVVLTGTASEVRIGQLVQGGR